MKLDFPDFPIKRKLMFLAMLTSCVALVMACAAFVLYEHQTFRRSMARDLGMIAEMTGANSAAGLTFDDASSVEQTLQSLAAHPRVIWACVFSKTGRVAATYERTDMKGRFVPPGKQSDQHVFSRDRLDLFRSILLKGEPIGSIFVASDLREENERLVRYLVIGLIVLVASSLVAFLLSSKLQRLISEPVYDLAQTVAAVAQNRNYAIRAAKRGNDELGTLIDGFNEMLSRIEDQNSALQEARNNLEKRVKERTRELQLEIEERKQAEARLAETHKKLVVASRQAGMAEVATGVLHNVGNVLNSVNVTATLLEDQLRKSELISLKRLMALLEDHQQDLGTYLSSDPKGKLVPRFMKELVFRFDKENSDLRSETQTLRKNIDHIKDIVAMQQSYAKVSGLIETVAITEMVEDSLCINAGALRRHEVVVVRELSELPPITTDKHKVLQILVNLVANAKYACDESGLSEKRLTVRTYQSNAHVCIQVADNGIGIPRENIVRIFQHGFTTRKDGHGFGLHSGALAAKELGGSLVVESKGRGQGATFTLKLPLMYKGG